MFSSVVVLLSLVALSLASPADFELVRRQSCAAYVIVDTRGTGTCAGARTTLTLGRRGPGPLGRLSQCVAPGLPSLTASAMIRTTLAAVPNGKTVETIYPASSSQISTAGTAFIIKTVRNGIAACPEQKFLLLGYSQGLSLSLDSADTSRRCGVRRRDEAHDLRRGLRCHRRLRAPRQPSAVRVHAG